MWVLYLSEACAALSPVDDFQTLSAVSKHQVWCQHPNVFFSEIRVVISQSSSYKEVN